MPDVFQLKRDGDVHLFISNGTPCMDILTRTDQQTFVDMALEKSKTHELIINGTFNSYSSWDALLSSNPLPVGDVAPTGPVIQNGKLISKASGAGKYYFAYRKDKTGRVYSSGIGDPPLTSTSGLGGLGGLVFSGRPHDARNEYAGTVDANAPATGEPPPRYAAQLRRRGNAMYATIENRGWTVGKVAVGFTPDARIVVGGASGWCQRCCAR